MAGFFDAYRKILGWWNSVTSQTVYSTQEFLVHDVDNFAVSERSEFLVHDVSAFVVGEN